MNGFLCTLINVEVEILNIIKRDGRVVPFDQNKIKNAVLKALNAVDKDVNQNNERIAEQIARQIENYSQNANHILNVEEIQDLCEKALMKADPVAAKAFIIYRNERTKVRERGSDLIRNVTKKLNASNVQNQNANVDERSFGGRMGESTRTLMKKYALDYCLSDLAKRNHLENEIYTHDLDSYAVGMHNCLSIPFDDLLKNGFNTRQTDVRPAQSINTAMQLVAVIFQLQSLQQFGGVSATHLDWTMVPCVRKSFAKHFCDGLKYVENTYTVDANDYKKKEYPIDSELYKNHEMAYQYAIDMTKRELDQSVQGLYHNLNTLQSRSGNQLPFTSINYGTCTLPEGRMVTKALLEASIDGVGKFHKTPIFPCGIFQCMKGVNRKPEDPNYDLFQLALRSTSQRLYPNYANVDWSVNEGYDINDPKTYVSTMGCRTYNGADANAEPGVNPQTKDGRGNIAPVTIILPTLAMEADGNIEKFMNLLDQKIYEAKIILEERFNWICQQTPESAKFMYENKTMEGYDGKTIFSAMKHGTLAIGQVGLAETLQILIGCNQTTKEGMNLAIRIESLFKQRCAEFKKELHHKDEWGDYYLNYGVYFTPAENLCHTAMDKFKERYGIIKNVSDKEFFTNSVHVPVWEPIDPFTKIDIESKLDQYSNAGCILYVELDAGVKNNLSALETLVNYAMDKDVPYFAVNIPVDTCMNCGYTDEINDRCPMCGSDQIQRLRRVTGYLTGDYTTAFNKGKQQEVEMRYKHSQRMPNWNK